MTQIWQRTLSIYVDVPESWLLPNGECLTDDNAVAAEAWKELRDNVATAIAAKFPKYTAYAQPTFNVDWEDTPQKEEE